MLVVIEVFDLTIRITTVVKTGFKHKLCKRFRLYDGFSRDKSL